MIWQTVKLGEIKTFLFYYKIIFKKVMVQMNLEHVRVGLLLFIYISYSYSQELSVHSVTYLTSKDGQRYEIEDQCGFVEDQYSKW